MNDVETAEQLQDLHTARAADELLAAVQARDPGFRPIAECRHAVVELQARLVEALTRRRTV